MTAAVIAALLWVAAGTRLWRWWWTRSVSVLGSFIILASLGVHMIENTAAGERLVGAVSGSQTIAVLYMSKLACIYAACFGSYLLVLDLADRGRLGQVRLRFTRHLIVMGTLFATSSVMFIAAGPGDAPDMKSWSLAHATEPGFAEAGAIGLIYPAFVCIMVAIAMFRGSDRRTPSGRGLATIGTGAAVLAAYATLRIAYLLLARFDHIEATSPLLRVTEVLALLGSLLVVVGMVGTGVGEWRTGRATLRAINRLSVEMLRRWDGVARPSRRGSTTATRADDRVAEILDAISMQAAADALPTEGNPLPTEHAARAIGTWLRSGQAPPDLNRASLGVPAGMSARQWIRAIATEFNQAPDDAVVR